MKIYIPEPAGVTLGIAYTSADQSTGGGGTVETAISIDGQGFRTTVVKAGPYGMTTIGARISVEGGLSTFLYGDTKIFSPTPLKFTHLGSRAGTGKGVDYTGYVSDLTPIRIRKGGFATITGPPPSTSGATPIGWPKFSGSYLNKSSIITKSFASLSETTKYDYNRVSSARWSVETCFLVGFGDAFAFWDYGGFGENPIADRAPPPFGLNQAGRFVNQPIQYEKQRMAFLSGWNHPLGHSAVLTGGQVRVGGGESKTGGSYIIYGTLHQNVDCADQEFDEREVPSGSGFLNNGLTYSFKVKYNYFTYNTVTNSQNKIVLGGLYSDGKTSTNKIWEENARGCYVDLNGDECGCGVQPFTRRASGFTYAETRTGSLMRQPVAATFKATRTQFDGSCFIFKSFSGTTFTANGPSQITQNISWYATDRAGGLIPFVHTHKVTFESGTSRPLTSWTSWWSREGTGGKDSGLVPYYSSRAKRTGSGRVNIAVVGAAKTTTVDALHSFARGFAILGPLNPNGAVGFSAGPLNSADKAISVSACTWQATAKKFNTQGFEFSTAKIETTLKSYDNFSYLADLSMVTAEKESGYYVAKGGYPGVLDQFNMDGVPIAKWLNLMNPASPINPIARYDYPGGLKSFVGE